MQSSKVASRYLRATFQDQERGQRILDAVADHFRDFHLKFRGTAPQFSMLGHVLHGHVDDPGGYAELTLNNTSGLYKITKLLISSSYLDPQDLVYPMLLIKRLREATESPGLKKAMNTR